MDVIKLDQYKKISVKEAKEFNIGCALETSEENYIHELLWIFLFGIMEMSLV